MAVEVRTRRLTNPGRRKVGAAKKKRKLSPKQIAIFGTPRQKAALRASKGRRKNAGHNSIRKTKKRTKAAPNNYHAKYGAKLIKGLRKRKRRKNIGEIVSVSLAGLGNPGRKRRKNTGMAKRRKARKTTATAVRRRRRTRRTRTHNPVVRRRRSYRRRRGTATARRRKNPTYRVRRMHHRRRNAGKRSMMGSGLLSKAIGVIAGAVGSRYLTQAVLGANNVGYVGYGANIAASFVMYMVAKKVAPIRPMAESILLGGVVSTVLRVISEKTGYGQYIQTALSGTGRGGDVGMGLITDSSFFSPQVAQPGSMTSFITPRATRGYVSSQMAQGAAMAQAGSPGKGMGSMVGRKYRGAIL